ncbi:MAG: hypothetical protein V3S41_07720 [Spirochaetia bacterium]
MRNTKPLLLSLLMLAGSALASADTENVTSEEIGDTWARALAATEGNAHWIPGETQMTMEFLNRKGETDQLMRILTTVTPTDNGLVLEMTELERPGGLIGALMPSDDLGSDGISGASNEDASSGFDQLSANPFLPEVQASLLIEATEESDIIDGVRSRAFAIGWVATDGTAYDGTIWLSAETAGPVRLEVTGDSASSDVQALSVAVTYQRYGATVLPASTVSSMEIRFALIIRIRIRMTLEFAKYFEIDETPEYIFQGFPGQEE